MFEVRGNGSNQKASICDNAPSGYVPVIHCDGNQRREADHQNHQFCWVKTSENTRRHSSDLLANDVKFHEKAEN